MRHFFLAFLLLFCFGNLNSVNAESLRDNLKNLTNDPVGAGCADDDEWFPFFDENDPCIKLHNKIVEGAYLFLEYGELGRQGFHNEADWYARQLIHGKHCTPYCEASIRVEKNCIVETENVWQRNKINFNNVHWWDSGWDTDFDSDNRFSHRYWIRGTKLNDFRIRDKFGFWERKWQTRLTLLADKEVPGLTKTRMEKALKELKKACPGLLREDVEVEPQEYEGRY